MQSNFWYVYILECSNDKTYIGCTSDLRSRFLRHRLGRVPATKEILPVRIRSYFAFKDKYVAYNFEKYLKSGSGRAFANKHFVSAVEK